MHAITEEYIQYPVHGNISQYQLRRNRFKTWTQLSTAVQENIPLREWEKFKVKKVFATHITDKSTYPKYINITPGNPLFKI